MTKLVLKNIRKAFGSFVAVEGLSLDIDEGETVALLGPSGCGKSTTLNMIVGLETPTSGDILIDGKSVADVPPGKRNVGLVFQDYAVFTHMTVRQNLAFGLRSQGMRRAEIDKKIDEVAELVGLGDAMGRSTKVLGGSELQRVALARTLVTNPSILLLDEPLSNLEAEMRAQMRRELRRIQGETRQTIIYVTHDQIEALSLAHRIAVMDQGALQQYGTAHEVYHRPANSFVGQFLGNPPMNMISGRLNRVNGGAAVEFVHGSVCLPEKYSNLAEMAGRDVNLGIRPEALSLGPLVNGHGFDAEYVVSEPQGAEAIVTFRLGEQIIKVVVNDANDIRSGETVRIYPDPALLAVFDSQSGVRLENAVSEVADT